MNHAPYFTPFSVFPENRQALLLISINNIYHIKVQRSNSLLLQFYLRRLYVLFFLLPLVSNNSSPTIFFRSSLVLLSDNSNNSLISAALADGFAVKYSIIVSILLAVLIGGFLSEDFIGGFGNL